RRWRDLLPTQLRVLALIIELFEVFFFSLFYFCDCLPPTSLIVDLSESAAIISLTASFIYLLSFFDIDFFQSSITHAPLIDRFILEEDRRLVPCLVAVVDRTVPRIPVPLARMISSV
ncbi:3-hydroxy-3-methylglutaryl-coenzyme A (HMG-CoA) reductase isozyme, partial [Sarracenia purpurea var. burkii]